VDFVKDAISSAEVNFLEAPDEESQKERRARSMAGARPIVPDSDRWQVVLTDSN